MKSIILYLLLPFSLSAHGKIYDCFLFFNELEILDIRLHEMAPYVDYFVLAEAEETFRGNPKPLYFQENKERFAPFLDKIIHVVIRGHIDVDVPFTREQMQRDRILAGLKDADDTDIVILSDVDEIIRGPMVRRLALPVLKGKTAHIGAVQTEYQFFLNRFSRYFLGSVLTTYKYLKTTTFANIRGLRPTTPQVENAGWHFTSMGGLEKYAQKLSAYSLYDRDTPEAKHPERFAKLVKKGPFVPIDEKFPKYVRENEDYFRSIGFIHQ